MLAWLQFLGAVGAFVQCPLGGRSRLQLLKGPLNLNGANGCYSASASRRSSFKILVVQLLRCQCTVVGSVWVHFRVFEGVVGIFKSVVLVAETRSLRFFRSGALILNGRDSLPRLRGAGRLAQALLLAHVILTIATRT